MPGIEGFDYDIVQSEQISIFARAREIATVTTEWAEDKFESGREKALPYIGGGALILAGMGVVAGEAHAQEPSASSSRINSLERKWSKGCKKDKKDFHMELVGSRVITELGVSAPHTLVAMSCSALKGVKLQVISETGRHTWKKNMRPGVMFEEEVDIKYPERDPAEIKKGVKWAAGIQAKKGRKMLFWEQLRFSYDIKSIQKSQEPAPIVQAEQ